MNTIERLLVDYKPGEPEMKPDVLKQIAEIDKQRKQQMEEMQRNNNGQIAITQDGKQIPLNNQQIVGLLQKQQEQIKDLTNKLMEKDKTANSSTANEENLKENIKKLITILMGKDKEINELKSKINTLNMLNTSNISNTCESN